MRRSALAPFLFLAVAAALPVGAQVNPPSKAGFPITLAGKGPVNFSHLALADLKITGGKAGVKSIIFGTDGGELHVIYQRASDNAWLEAPGFPVVVCAANTCSGLAANSPVLSSPAVGDLDGDCIPEIVIGYGGFTDNKSGGVKAYKNNGQVLWSRTSFDLQSPANGPDPVVGSPAIGDVDGDGQNDVVWGSTDFRVYFVRGPNGADKPNWPRYLLDTVLSSPVLKDLNGDGKLEIIIGVDAHFDATFQTPGNGGCLHVMPATQPDIDPNPNHFPGSIGYPVDLPGFPKCVDQVIYHSPVVGDIDGDGQPEIVHGTGNFFANGTERIYAWKKDGSAVPGWPVTVLGQAQYDAAPALADLNGDSVLDVVVTTDNTRSSGGLFRVYAIRGNGAVLPGWPKVPKDYFGANSNAGSPLIADVLGSTSAPEILVPSGFEIVTFDTAGNQLTNAGNTFLAPGSLYSIAVDDLDPGDGKIEVVAVAASGGSTVINVWNPVSRATLPLWGMFHKDASRSQDAPGTGPCRVYGACAAPLASPKFFSVSPCRLVDTRAGQTAPIGGPSLASGGNRDFTLRGLCGIPAAARALSLNVTVVSPTGAGFVRFSPSCLPPNASTINFSAFQTRANNAILSLGTTDGLLTANSSVSGFGTVDLIIDVNGWFQQ